MEVFHFALWSFLRKKGKDPSSNLGGATFFQGILQLGKTQRY